MKGKVLVFAITGLIGALIGGLLAEIPYSFLPKSGYTDVIFVLDDTGSMQFAADGVRNGISQFASEFSNKSVKVKFGLIAFSDETDPSAGGSNEPNIIYKFDDLPVTADIDKFKDTVRSVPQRDGGDLPESSGSAIMDAANLPIDPADRKILILITDDIAKFPDKRVMNLDGVIQAVNANNILQFDRITTPEKDSQFAQIRGEIPGIQENIQNVKDGDLFAGMLKEVGAQISTQIATLQGTGGASSKDLGVVYLITAIASALVGIGIALWLIGGQNKYLRKPLLSGKEVVTGTIFGGLAGIVGGLAGQFLVTAFPSGAPSAVPQAIGWALLGGILGSGLATFVPNMKRIHSAVAGLIGGLAGGAGFLVVANVLTSAMPHSSEADRIGRIIGWCIIGACIGAVIAVVEEMVREAWLVVEYGPGERRTVGLGEKPVVLGSNSELVTVYISTAAPVECAFSLREGHIYYENRTTGATTQVTPGTAFPVGRATVFVESQKRTGALAPKSSEPPKVLGAPPAAVPPRAAPTPTQAAIATPAPMPATPTPAAPSPAAAAPAGPVKPDYRTLQLPNGKTITVAPGQRLSSADLGLPGNVAAIAEVSRHPSDVRILGLRNLSQATWTVRNPQGKNSDVLPTKSAVLESGSAIVVPGGTLLVL